jgi:hypothetical protein
MATRCRRVITVGGKKVSDCRAVAEKGRDFPPCQSPFESGAPDCSRNVGVAMMTMGRQEPICSLSPAMDKLVLATVNAPYKRDISAAALCECLAHAEPGAWPVHLASFFTDVDPDLVFGFAASHGISKVALAEAYAAMKAATGECNPILEHELGPLATAAP